MMSHWRKRYNELNNYKLDIDDSKYIWWLQHKLDIVEKIIKAKGTATYKITVLRSALVKGK